MLVLFIRVLGGLALAVGVLPAQGCELTAMTAASMAATSGSTLTTFRESALTEDGLVKEAWKLQVFTAFTRPSLEQDAARGGGEYLTSFAQLGSMPAEQHAAFTFFAQEQASTLLHLPGPPEVVRLLNSAPFSFSGP